MNIIAISGSLRARSSNLALLRAFAQASLVETLRTMNWRVVGTWAAPKKVRDENVDDEVAAVIREALKSLSS
jgi:NAD(P)H-dependent FMN reductase